MKEWVFLKDYTTFRIGGRARYFFDVKNEEELREAVIFAKKENLLVIVLGGGSNVLLEDEDFLGVVVHISILGISFLEKKDEVKITAGGGENWDDLVLFTVKKGLWGIENLSYIPGSVGGAPVQNIGAYGCEIKDCLDYVCVFDTNTLSSYKLLSKECQFSYRSSIFKTVKGKHLIVTGICLSIYKKPSPNISYKGLSEYLKKEDKESTVISIRDAVIAIRKTKLPDVNKIGTAGSFFKNPVILRERYDELLTKFPNMPGIESENSFVKISAAWLLDHLGSFKGEKEGGASVWNLQPLVIVNNGGASSRDVKTLAKRMQKKIFDVTGILLEPEVVIF